MPFDGKVYYFETKPAPVYDRENPPPTMAEAIRMAVADVEAQERAGVQYEWGDCARCTAGAVVRRAGGKLGDWNSLGAQWRRILSALSECSYNGVSEGGYLCAGFNYWPEGFSAKPRFEHPITQYETNPTAFKRDMLALADRLEREGGQ